MSVGSVHVDPLHQSQAREFLASSRTAVSEDSIYRVAVSGARFTTIAAALAQAITDGRGMGSPAVISVAAGFWECNVTLPSGIGLAGHGFTTFIMPASAALDTITLEADAFIANCYVVMPDSPKYAIVGEGVVRNVHVISMGGTGNGIKSTGGMQVDGAFVYGIGSGTGYSAAAGTGSVLKNVFIGGFSVGASVTVGGTVLTIIGLVLQDNTTELSGSAATITVHGELRADVSGFSGTLTYTNLISSAEIALPKYAAVAGTYPVAAADSTVECTANTFTVTLPTAVGRAGKIFNIKNSGAGVITVATTSAQTIDGNATATLNQWNNLAVQSNNANWIIL